MKTIRFTILFLSLLIITNIQAKKMLSEYAEISLLTCENGTELYNSYGHSAIRIKDPINQIDMVFNYGTFDFNTPYFLPKFVRGTLDYSLSTEPFEWFYASYQDENRSVYEQVLLLTLDEKQRIFNRLLVNYETDEKYYRYDFFYDNCSSRIHEIFKEVLGETLVYGPNIEANSSETFRDLINPYMKHNVWADFGVGIIMGYPTDNKATNKQKMFLPLEMMKRFEMATYNNQKWVKQTRVLFTSTPKTLETPLIQKPVFLFSMLALIVALISWYSYKNQLHFYWLDYLLLSITGLLGIFFLLMWIGTRHSPTFENMNMFWAMPLNLIAIFFLRKPKMKMYFLAMFILNIVGFWLLPQVFHIAILPISFMMAIRYFLIYNSLQTK